MISHYWWQCAIERGEEVVMIIKTRASLAEGVAVAVKENAFLHDARDLCAIESGSPAIWIGDEGDRKRKRKAYSKRVPHLRCTTIKALRGRL